MFGGVLGVLRYLWSLVLAQVAEWKLIASAYREAFAEARRNPKPVIIRFAIVTPIVFALYMIYLHSPAAASGPGPSCQAWGTAQAGNPGPLSQSLSKMTGGATASTWMNNATAFVAIVFWALMVVQLTQDVIDYMLQTAGTGTLSGFFGQYGRVLLMNLLIAGLFVNLPTITYAFFSGAGEAGQSVTGVSPAPWYSDIFSFQPGIISDEGVCIQDEMDSSFYTLANQKMQFSWTDPGKSMQNAIEYATAWITEQIGATAVNIAYLIIAVIFTFAALEVFFVAGLGMLAAGGMSHRSLHFMPMMYRAAAFGLFMKVAALGAISAFGATEADTWAAMVANASSLDQLVPICKEVMYGAVGFALLGGCMPGIIAKHFGGGVMGQNATMAIGRVGNTAGNQVQRNMQSPTNRSNNGSPGPGGGGGGGSQNQPRTNSQPTMSGTP